MIINVSKNKITIDKGHTANKGEYNIRICDFVFSEDYTDDLSKVAVFSKDGEAYKVDIVNNQCIIPIEVLEEKGTITIGVYAYSVIEESGEEVLEKRFSPAPAQIFMDYGSYIKNAENASHPTPTEIEQLSARISAVEIDAQQVEINTQNIATLQEELPTKTSDLTNDSGFITSETDPVFSASASFNITSQDITNWNNKSDFSGNYNDLTNKPTIATKTSDLTNDSGFVSNTDYATADKGGVVKTNKQFYLAEDGKAYAGYVSYNGYNASSNDIFIGKGTLENVITGKDLTTKSYVDGLVGDISSTLDSINGEVV